MSVDANVQTMIRRITIAVILAHDGDFVIVSGNSYHIGIRTTRMILPCQIELPLGVHSIIQIEIEGMALIVYTGQLLVIMNSFSIMKNDFRDVIIDL